MALQPLPLADGIRVQRLGFGTWAWGNKLLWGYDTDDDPQLQAAFNAAVRQQNPFDTGDSYGTGKSCKYSWTGDLCFSYRFI